MDQIVVNWHAEIPDPNLIDFLNGFQENRKKEIAVLKRLLEEKDFDGMRKMGHNWKGFSRPYGYIALETLGKMLEAAALQNDLSQCQSLFQQFVNYINEKEVRLRNKE